jgi:hypothetical protein
VLELSWPQAWSFRLARHHLLERASRDGLVEVVRGVGAIHAQVMGAAEQSLAIRIAGLRSREIEAALWEERRLVKTFGPRGTVHLVAPEDVATFATAASVSADQRHQERRLRAMGVAPEQLRPILEAIADALDGRRLTLVELGEAVAERLGAWVMEETAPAFGGSWPRWRMCIGAAAAEGLLCYGPNRGRLVTFVRADQWLGGWPQLDGEDACREVFLRYLAAYGPATARDFAQWFAIDPLVASAIHDTVQDQVEEVSVEGETRLMLATDLARPLRTAGPTVHLLPHFDCYLIGCHPRSELFPRAWTERGLPIGGGGNLRALLVDGTVAGIWDPKRTGKRLEVRVEAFVELSASQRDALGAEAHCLAELTDLEPSLVLGPITARPHL